MTSSDLRLTEYEKKVAARYNNNDNSAVNQLLGDIDGLYHHHFGIGNVNPAAWTAGDSSILAELHRLETAQAEFLLDQLGDVGESDALLDAGCGRGSVSIMAHQRFGCYVDGISIAEKHVAFANEQAKQRGVANRVRFHYANMLCTGLPGGSRRAVWADESSGYVNLIRFYGEIARLLVPGGRYVCIDAGWNDATVCRVDMIDRIDKHYVGKIPAYGEHFRALAANNLAPVTVTDLTAAAIPYWELRAQSSVASGIENTMLTAYREGSLRYFLIVAERILVVAP